MPGPFFSGGGEGADWYNAAMRWNQDRSQELNRPTDYGLMGGDPGTSEGRTKNLYHQQMMDLILAAMMSEKGMAAYRGAQQPMKTDDLSRGTRAVKNKKDSVSAADALIEQDLR